MGVDAGVWTGGSAQPAGPARSAPPSRGVFIGGCPRSGTTMLGAMLGAHPDCVCVPEMPFKIELLREFDWRRPPGRAELARALGAHWRFRFWELDRESLGGGSEEEPPESYPEVVQRLVRSYARRVDRAEARVWVDHTPANTRYASTLFELFPESKVIHLVRDGRAIAASVLPLDWGPNSILRAAAWWVKNLAFGLAAEQRWGEERVLRVRYEDLLGNPAAALRVVCEFLEIEKRPEMLAPTGFALPRYTETQHTLVGAELVKSRADAWRSALTSREVEVFESLTGDMLAYLGYARMFGPGAGAPRRGEEMRWHAADAARTAGNLVRRLRRMRGALPRT